LRYSMKNGVLRVERDLPYVEMYTLDFLNMERSSTSSVNVSTSVLSSSVGGGGGGDDSSSSDSSSSSSSSSGGSSGGGGLTTGSSSSVTSSTASDFWVQFESGIVSILSYAPQLRTSEYLALPQQTAATPAATPGTVPAAGAAAGAGAASTPESAAAPAASSGATSASQGAGAAAAAPTTAQYTINRQASTLTVLATERQHRLVKEFIKKLE